MYGPKSGGLKTTILELSRQYELLGNDVLVITPGEKDSFVCTGRITHATVAAPRIPFSGGYRIILRVNYVMSRIREFNPDVLEISDRTTLLKVARWAEGQGIPTTFFAHERVDGLVKSFAKFLPFKVKFVTHWNCVTRDSVSRIVATTEFAAEEFQQLGMITSSAPQSKLVSIPLGVDLDRFSPFESEDEERAINQPYILACTRLSKEKDPLFLISIAEELERRGVDSPLYIAGSGPLEAKMRKMIYRKNLNIRLLGFISEKEELAQWMREASIFLAVGPIETFGLAALETLASGTPVICRSEAAISEIVSVESGKALTRSASDWADAIQQYLASDREFTRIHARARAEQFTWRNTADQLLSLYREDLAS
jgi:alpha-1,6-mannosyltransferase